MSAKCQATYEWSYATIGMVVLEVSIHKKGWLMVTRTTTPQVLFSLPSNLIEDDCACADIPATALVTTQTDRGYQSKDRGLLSGSTENLKEQAAERLKMLQKRLP